MQTKTHRRPDDLSLTKAARSMSQDEFNKYMDKKYGPVFDAVWRSMQVNQGRPIPIRRPVHRPAKYKENR